MKNIAKSVKKQIQSNKKSVGGEMMKVGGVSDPRFSRVKSEIMFPEKEEKDDGIEEAHKHPKEGSNPNKKVKVIKKMKNPGKKKK